VAKTIAQVNPLSGRGTPLALNIGDRERYIFRPYAAYAR
jgi:hypothetical protein